MAQVARLDAVYWDVLGLSPVGLGQPGTSFMTVVVMETLLSGVIGLLAIVLSFQAGGERGACAAGLFLAVWSYLLAYAGVAALLRPADPGSPFRPLFEGHFLGAELLGLAALLRFSAVFPRELEPLDLDDPETLPVGLRLLQSLRRWLLRPAAPYLAAPVVGLVAVGVNRAMGRALPDTPFLFLVELLPFLTLAFVVANLRQSYLRATEGGRASIHWLVVGFTLLLVSLGIVIGANVLQTVTGWRFTALNWRSIVLNLGFLGLVWGVAMGLLYRGTLEPGKLARRLLLVAATALAGFLLASALEALSSGRVVLGLDLPPGLGAAAAAWLTLIAYNRFKDPVYEAMGQAWGGPAAPPVRLEEPRGT